MQKQETVDEKTKQRKVLPSPAVTRPVVLRPSVKFEPRSAVKLEPRSPVPKGQKLQRSRSSVSTPKPFFEYSPSVIREFA